MRRGSSPSPARPIERGVLAALRARFDEHGDPLDPPVWLWRAGPDWQLRPDRPI